MGLHDFICPQCQTKFEAMRIEGNTCPSCGFDKPAWQPSAMIPSFKPFWHPNLDHNPVYIDSAKSLDRELNKRGLHIPENHVGRKAPARLPETEKEARNA